MKNWFKKIFCEHEWEMITVIWQRGILFNTRDFEYDSETKSEINNQCIKCGVLQNDFGHRYDS